MPNYFFTDSDGNKWGPLPAERLQTLIDRGTIAPTTQLETDTGHTGLAGQIPGLNFNNVAPPPYTQREGNAAGSVVSWVFDFAFRDLRLPEVNLWVCRIVYVIVWIAAILAVSIETYQMLTGGSAEVRYAHGELFTDNRYALMGGLQRIFTLLGVWIYNAALIIVVRIACEWQCILLDWITETRKAARKYTAE